MFRGEAMVVLFSGLPAAGKSWFCGYLVREHGFTHYDLESFPQGWPQPALKTAWDTNRSEFVRQLKDAHPNVALDWGFPPSYLSWINELGRAGVRLVWFSADAEQARKVFTARGGVDITHFNAQLEAIRKADLPHAITATVIETLGGNGRFLPLGEVFGKLKSVFGSA
jgi:hypothetical protein